MSLNARLTIFKCRATSPKPDAAAAASADEALQHHQPPRPVFKSLANRFHRSQEQSGAQPCSWPQHANPALARSISISSSNADNAAEYVMPDVLESKANSKISGAYIHSTQHAPAGAAAVHSTPAVEHAADISDAFAAPDAMDHDDSDIADMISSEESEQLSGESDMSSDGYNTEDEEEENNSCCMIEDELHREPVMEGEGQGQGSVQHDLAAAAAAAAAVAANSTPVPGTLLHHLSSSFAGSLPPDQQQQQQPLGVHKQQQQQQHSDDGSSAAAAAAAAAKLLSAHIPARVCCPVTPPPSPAVDTAALQQQQGNITAVAAATHGPLAVHMAHAVQAVVTCGTAHLASPLVTTSRRGSTPSGRRGSTPGSWSHGLGRRAWAWLAGDILGSPTATVAVTATPPPSPALLQL